MKFIGNHDISEWLAASVDLEELRGRWLHPGAGRDDTAFGQNAASLPLHVELLLREREPGKIPADYLCSIPFYSLCRGLFVPLSGLTPQRSAQLFGLALEPAATGEDRSEVLARQKLVERFLSLPVGLSLLDRICFVLGDPFAGGRSSLRRDSLLRLLSSLRFVSRSDLLDQLTRAGDIAVLFANACPAAKGDPPLTAMEVLESLRLIPRARALQKFAILRSLLDRCGRLEAYFLIKLLLRSAGFGFDYQGPLLAQLLAAKFGAAAEAIEQAMALTDIFHVTKVLEEKGPAGLQEIQLQPLVAVRPALAAGTTEEIEHYPVFVERKYDGVRLLLHKTTDAQGGVLCGAYTRNRSDWSELVPGLEGLIRRLACRSVILDGELYGMAMDGEGGIRPATVYDVHTTVLGNPARPTQLRYAAFDLLYLNGQDLTGLPLQQRRQFLQTLVQPLAQSSSSLPISVSEGLLATGKEEVSRLYHHFRAQGYEGIIAKDPQGRYALARRDPGWVKRKPEVTLDVALVGAVYSVTSKENAGLFGSYVIAIRTPEGGFQVVGDVAGIDRARDMAIQSEIMQRGLLTGRRIERPSATGVRPGVELRPAIVATVRFEGIIRDRTTETYGLRDPKIALIRSDKSAFEADSTADLQKLYLAQNVG